MFSVLVPDETPPVIALVVSTYEICGPINIMDHNKVSYTDEGNRILKDSEILEVREINNEVPISKFAES